MECIITVLILFLFFFQSQNDVENSVNNMNFDEKKYVNGKKIHEDPFEENSFNRKASDELSSERSIPDTRHARYKIGINLA